MGKPKPLHFNIPQIMAMLVRATKNYFVMSRGIGKSYGIVGPWMLDIVRQMPRSLNGIVGATFQQLLVRTLPPVFNSWAQMGYLNGVHYVVGREPSERWKRLWNWQGPRTKPRDSQHAIYHWNGTCHVLISQDRPGSSNSFSLASIGGDEAKLLNKERLDDETMPALRGDRSHYGHLPCYRSELFTTDMPTHPKAKWILDKADEMDEEQISLILQLQLQINKHKKEMLTAHPEGKRMLQGKINILEREVLKLRLPRKVGSNDWKYSVHYAEANVYDNLDVLGEEYLADMRKTLSDAKFRASILNERITRIDGGFYGSLDTDHHGREWFDYGYIDNYIGKELYKETCLQDSGYIKGEPLEISLDYGTFNCLVTFQEVKDEFRTFRNFYTHHPLQTEDVVKRFCEYYEPYPTKRVNYWYDHTATAGDGRSPYTYAQIVVQTLRRNGWSVNEIPCGLAPNHSVKYELIGAILREQDSRLPKFRYSKTGCAQLETSMLNAGVKQGRNGFEKDKAPERDPNINPEDAPHLSDALDTPLFFKYHHRVVDDSSYVPMHM